MRLKIIFQIFKKEILEVRRDKRIILVTVLIPILLFPFLFKIFNLKLKQETISSQEIKYISIKNCDEKFEDLLNKNNFFDKKTELNSIEDLSQGEILAILNCKQVTKLTYEVEIIINNIKQTSLSAYTQLSQIVGIINNQTNSKNTTKNDKIILNTLYDPKTASGILLMIFLLPLLLFLFSSLATMLVAGDMFAGEKERKTIEHLIAVPIYRSEILYGKFIAVVVVGSLGVLSYFLGMLISFYLVENPFNSKNFMFNLSYFSIFKLSLILISLVIFFSSLHLTISVFSRSIKEAQLLSLPIIILSVAISQMDNAINISGSYAIYHSIPILNFSLVIKEIILRNSNMFWIILACSESFLLSFLLMRFATYLSKKEKYILNL
jgi:sodium transport system permease protein